MDSFAQHLAHVNLNAVEKALLTDLKACSGSRDLERGKQIHSNAIKCGHSSIYVANALISMYGKCGSMVNAHQVFDSVTCPTVVSWTALISGYAENGQSITAIELFTMMRTEGSVANCVTFVVAIKACTALVVRERSRRWIDAGNTLQNLVEEFGCSSNIFVQNTLLDMHAKSDSMVSARQVFDNIKHRNVVSWNSLIWGYADNGQGYAALELFIWMRNEGLAPDPVTIVAVLKACAILAVKGEAECTVEGRAIHNLAIENGSNSDVYVQDTLVDMYAKCGSMSDAHQVFDSMKHLTVVSWTALILGYADNGQGRAALDVFIRMRKDGPAANSVTFVAVSKACTSLAVQGGCVECGKVVHNIATENGCSGEIHVQSTLVDMYSKCGSMVDACQVFLSMKHPDVVSWTALILGYAENGQGVAALELFSRLRTEGLAPDSVTFVAALKACTSLAIREASGCKDRGKAVHNIAMENECSSNMYVQSTVLDMFAKCGNIEDARHVFDSIKNRDVVSSNALMVGYVENGQGQNALELFTRMRNVGPVPDSLTYTAALKACALIGALNFGRTIHSEINNHYQKGLDLVLVNSLIDFYAKCGSLVEARTVFCLQADTRDVITWNVLLAGFSSCGENKVVFELFKEMQDAGFWPDDITITCLLTCCSHAGLVEKGKECFDAMTMKYGIVPTLKHYTSMIDIFGRANKLDDAIALLQQMPFSPDDVTWMTVLSACHKWKNVEIGRLAFKSLIQFKDRVAAGYTLMGQIYGSRGMLDEQEMLMRMKI